MKGNGVVRKEGLTDTLGSSCGEWEGSEVANRPDQCAEVAADWSRGVPGGGQGCLRGPDGGSSME